ncbi:hypothetical protein [Microbulbifer pacificus]|uniref:hypothetical protein n=1 Tax=Microbulbifer pacificus TaxID=407164 RepID=UPI000CF4AA28|nr:hypothetical protein [Microbulbifer pacificus]
MNTRHLYRTFPATLFLCGIIANPAVASEAALPHTFSAGAPARAGEVNENFSALESAVNDNNSRIDTNADAIDDNAADILANSEAIQQIKALRSNIYPVNVAAVNNAGYPNLRMNSSGMYNITDLTDIVQAPVILPDGATVEDMTCLVRDNSDTANFSGGNILLMRVALEEGAPPAVYESLVDIDLTTAGNVSGLRKLVDEDGIVENALIDNSKYMYYVRFWIQRTQAVSNLMISGCRISYQS